MNKVELKDVKDDIRGTKWINAEEIFKIAKYSLKSYFYSLVTFGSKSTVTKMALEVWHSFFNNFKEETKLKKAIIKHANDMDYAQTMEFLDDLDRLNEKSAEYYYDWLDAIDDACEMKREYRAIKSKKEFAFLTETDSYRKRLCCMALTVKDVKDSLNLPSHFWDYMESRTIQVAYYGSEVYCENDDIEAFFGVYMKFDQEEKLTDIKMIVPKIIDSETAYINVHEYQQAYALYQSLGKKVDERMFVKDNHEEQEARFRVRSTELKYEQLF